MNVLFVYRNDSAGYSIQRCFKTIEEYFSKVDVGINIISISLPCKRAYPHHLLIDIIYVIFHLFKRKYDIIHVTGGCPHVMFVKPICRLLGVKMVSTIHDLGFYNPNNTSLINKWHYYVGVKSLRFADNLIFISDATKEEANRLYSISNIPYKIIGDPVDPNITNRKRQFNIDNPVILHIGTHQRKNLEGTIKALKGLRYQLRIIGDLSESQLKCLKDNGTYFTQVANLTSAEIIDEYFNCDIVSFPTFYEGFGMPIIEAQATGRPVVTSNISPMKDVAGKQAVLVDPFDISSIRKGFEYAMDNYDTIVEFGLQNVKRYKVESIATEYLLLYKSLLSK